MENDNAGIIYLDFSKACHTICHDRLQVKMKKQKQKKNLGTSKETINIVRYFLTML